MTDKLKTYEFRCRGRIRAKSKRDARVALNTPKIINIDAWIYTKSGAKAIYLKLQSIELLGEVEGE